MLFALLHRPRGDATRKSLTYVVSVLVALAMQASTSGAFAADTKQRVIVLRRDLQADSLESQFATALRAHLTELDLTLEVSAAPASTSPFDVVAALRARSSTADALVVAWIVPQKPRTIVYVFEPKGPRLRARAVSVSESSVAASEELALMLRSAIVARREGGELEMAEVALPAAASAPVTPNASSGVAPSAGAPRATPPRTDARGRELAMGLYSGYVHNRALSEGHAGEGFALRAFGMAATRRFGVGYAFLPTTSIQSELTDVTIQRHPIQIFLTQALVGDEVRLFAELFGTLDPMRRRTPRAEPPLTQGAPTWRYAASLAGLVRLEARLVSTLHLSVGAGAEFALNSFAFEVDWDQDRYRVARILPVRPVGDLGLVWVTR